MSIFSEHMLSSTEGKLAVDILLNVVCCRPVACLFLNIVEKIFLLPFAFAVYALFPRKKTIVGGSPSFKVLHFVKLSMFIFLSTPRWPTETIL